MNETAWYGARCAFRFDGFSDDRPGPVFEEQITLHRARSFEEAFQKAERAALTYQDNDGPKFLGTIDVYLIDEELEDGTEVFSLLRVAEIGPAEYVRQFIHTGKEVESLRTRTYRVL